MFSKLWNDEAGIVTLEYLILGTVLALALVVGVSNLATALNVELTELSNAIMALDQSYSYEAASGCSGTHGGATVSEAVGSVGYGQSAAVTPTISTTSLTTTCP